LTGNLPQSRPGTSSTESAASTNKDAPAFLAYLKTADAQSVFEAQGFKVLLNY
jgi:ABC-type molybdate transport system substrate-binding protein